jgi:hypothetical protein
MSNQSLHGSDVSAVAQAVVSQLLNTATQKADDRAKMSVQSALSNATQLRDLFKEIVASANDALKDLTALLLLFNDARNGDPAAIDRLGRESDLVETIVESMREIQRMFGGQGSVAANRLAGSDLF